MLTTTIYRCGRLMSIMSAFLLLASCSGRIAALDSENIVGAWVIDRTCGTALKVKAAFNTDVEWRIQFLADDTYRMRFYPSFLPASDGKARGSKQLPVSTERAGKWMRKEPVVILYFLMDGKDEFMRLSVVQGRGEILLQSERDELVFRRE